MSKYYVEVRFKKGRQHWYVNPREVPLEIGDGVIVNADRGEDMGIVVHQSSESLYPLEDGKEMHEVIRRATKTDDKALLKNRSREEEAVEICVSRIESRKLNMKLVDVEMQFDGNKITFYFTAEKRIDFRELVKDLASTFKTRIELRQIGVRDEAKRLSGCGPCGNNLCCSTFLREFSPVTLRMARDQHLALSPNKISGVCGRLMCCLAYERDTYLDMLHEFPRTGTRIRAGELEGKVVKADVFSRTLTIRTAEERETRISLDEITEVLKHDKWVSRKTE